MANRVLIGDRATGGEGFYVSKWNTVTSAGDNVLTTTNSLQFDSRMGASLIVQSYGQGSIAGNSSVTITHNLGYIPAFAVRWSDQGDITSGLATVAYSPNTSSSTFSEVEEEEVVDEGEVDWGCELQSVGVNSFRITNESNNDMGLTNRTIYYAYVIFHEADFTGGHGL